MLDLRAALRALRRSPAFTMGAVLTLGLALGLVTMAFGLLAGAVTGGPQDGSTDRVVVYLTETDGGRAVRMRWPFPAVRVLAESATSFERLASYTGAQLNASGGANAERLQGEFISPAYFEIVDVSPALGRLPLAASASGQVRWGLAPDEGPDEVVISDGFWRRAFGGRPDVIGRELRVSQRPLTIVGVMPPGFQGLSGRAEAWMPFTLSPMLNYDDYFTSTEYFHTVIGQLRPGVTLEQARSEVTLIAARIAQVVPPRADDATNRGADLDGLNAARTNAATVRARTLVAIGAVLVLLIAAVNVATLVVARMTGRQREFAVRLALGGSGWRVFRTVAVEMAVIMAGGFAAALIAALWARDLIVAVIPATIASASNDYGALASFSGLLISGPVIGVVALVAAATTFLVAFLAYRRVLGGDVAEMLKRGGTRGTASPGGAHRTLLAVQIAVSIALLVSAGLLLRTVAALDNVEPGFDPRNLLAFSVSEDLPLARPDTGPLLADALLRELRRVGGVTGVTVAQSTPFSARGARLAFIIEGRPDMEADPPVVGWHRVGPDHFAVMGIPVIRGRGFTAEDRRGRAPVVVINQAAVRRFFPDRDPIGQRVRLSDTAPGDPPIAEIVGVVDDVVYWPVDAPARADVYQPAFQFSHPWTTVMVRTAGDPMAQVADFRAAVQVARPNLPIFDIVTLGDLARTGRADRRFLSGLLVACAGLGLILAVIGVYSVTASWMEARRRELGVRIALGAEPAALVRLVMQGTLLQTGLGLGAGLVISIAAGRALASTLFGVAPYDPITLAAAAAVMLVASGSAAYLPARRARHVDPIRELNAE